MTFNCFHTFYSFFLPHTIILWAMSCPLYDLVIISYSLSPKSHTDRFHFTYYSRKTLSCGKTDLLFKCVVKLLHTDRKMFRCMWPTMENEFDIPALNYLTKSCCLFFVFVFFLSVENFNQCWTHISLTSSHKTPRHSKSHFVLHTGGKRDHGAHIMTYTTGSPVGRVINASLHSSVSIFSFNSKQEKSKTVQIVIWDSRRFVFFFCLLDLTHTKPCFDWMFSFCTFKPACFFITRTTTTAVSVTHWVYTGSFVNTTHDTKHLQ